MAEPSSPRPAPEPELLDLPGLGFDETERALAGLARVNRFLLGYRPFVAALVSRLAAGPRRARLLDLGTGTGEAPALLAARAARAGVAVTVVGVDRKLAHLVIGRRQGYAQHRVVADAGALPFRGESFDWAASSLFFHHFDATGNRRILGEMRRVAAHAAVVDLRRSALAPRLARLAFPLLGVCRITRHDGLASLDRSWTLGAVADLVDGLPVAELRARFPFRFSLVLYGEGGGR